MIPYSRQCVDEDDIAAVEAVLRGDWLTTGPAVSAFEEALADHLDVRHAIAVNSGTAALHLALLAGGIGPGDRVATTTMSFSASANCAIYVGADVALVDIDPETLNLSLDEVSRADAVVAVDFTGLPVDLSRLRQRPRLVIEDAAQALGARRSTGPVGNCAEADMTTFSFHPVKSITTAEGGAVTTNDDRLAERIVRLRSHGMAPTPSQGGWSYEIDELGYNFRMPDVLAALGTSQLAKLDGFVAERNRLAARYRSLLSDHPDVQLPPAATATETHAYHLFVVQVPERRRIYDELRAVGIGVQVHHIPIYNLGPYRRRGFKPESFPNTEQYYRRALSLPVYPGLTEEQQDFVVRTLTAALGARSGSGRSRR